MASKGCIKANNNKQQRSRLAQRRSACVVCGRATESYNTPTFPGKWAHLECRKAAFELAAEMAQGSPRLLAQIAKGREIATEDIMEALIQRYGSNLGVDAKYLQQCMKRHRYADAATHLSLSIPLEVRRVDHQNRIMYLIAADET